MPQTILITGATDGIGYETAKDLAAQGHNLWLHGRNPDKLMKVKSELSSIAGAGNIQTYEADFSNMKAVDDMAASILADHNHLDILINNAGVYKTS